MFGYLIVLLGGVQGILLGCLIFIKRNAQPANAYLAYFVLLLGIGSLIDNNFLEIPTGLFVVLWSGNAFLFGPLLYLYFKRLSGPIGVRTRALYLHFLPFLMMKIVVLTIHFSPLSSASWTTTLGMSLNLLLALFNVGYGFLVYRSLKIFKTHVTQEHFTWVRVLGMVLLGFGALLMVRRVLQFSFFPEIAAIDDYIYTLATLLLYWVSYKIIQQPSLLATNQKYRKSGLSNRDITINGLRIKSLLEQGQTFTRQEVSLNYIAQSLNLPRHQVSQIIGEYFNLTFYELLTQLRIKEVQRRLGAPMYAHLSILGIALECGFQSKSAFNKAFKKITGATPSSYQHELLQAS